MSYTFIRYILITLCCIGTLNAQTKIQGIAIDTLYKNILRSASVSIYEKGKESVEKVTLTDAYGKFVVNDLAANKPYLLELRYQGFQKVLQEFMLSKNEEKDFGKIHMAFVENQLEEVEVIPPVRMNGDTLEFNADAFQLDSNAVVEDLLRKLPGVVVWGDGSLTYNGREIPNVLVNGKEFFGSDKAIVLQNLSKDAVKKLQVYDKRNEKEKKENPHDVKYEMNVALKKGKENMYFGNASIGLGTTKRYQQHANFNLAKNKSQFTLGYSGNNSNKNLQNMDQLLRNTSFKGVGINADFDSDFLSTGINNQHVLGSRYQYDIIGTNEVNRKHNIIGNVLSRWDNIRTESHSTTTLLSEEHNNNTRTNNNQNENHRQNQQMDLRYTNTGGKIKERQNSFTANINAYHQKNQDESDDITQYNYEGNHAENTANNNSNNQIRRLNFSSKLDVYGVNSSPNMRMTSKGDKSFWQLITYGVLINSDISQQNNRNERKSTYINYDNDSLNRNDHRFYDNKLDQQTHDIQLTANYNDWRITQKISYYHTNTDNDVKNLIGNQFEQNTDLSHISTFNRVQYMPTIHYSKNIGYTNMDGRYSNSTNLNMSLGSRFHNEKNSSSLDYRNLEQHFGTFIPKIGINNYYTKNGKYYMSSALNFEYDEEYPNLDRLRPIYDNSHVAFRYFGAEHLNKTSRSRITLSNNYNEQRQHGYSGSVSLGLTLYKNGLTDSIVYVPGQQQNYVTQIKDLMKLYYFSGNLDKSYLIGKNQTLNMQFRGNLNWGNKFQYMDQEKQEMLHNAQNIELESYYTLVDRYQIGWTNGWNRYSRYNKLGNSNNDYVSNYWSSGLSMSYSLTNRWQINSNATSRLSTSGTYKDHALIWNANTSYRMMKGNNLEVKLAAYDLLQENKGLYMLNGLTEFTQGYRNNLTQYFMLSLSYFPRKFGF
ncbi:hypothetical protein ACFX5U_06180 [Sphingobacterium sp. SG20118]|uniref:hypothetical protein n=1 Tax=Sphingobacterium sp. SG20118 TaxID=3367156 RepID=UPI0037DFC765